MINPVAAEGAPPASLVASLTARGIVLEAIIGHGGAGTVYRARDAKHDRAVAVKVLRAGGTGSASDERFAREITIIAGLRHPNILPLYDSGTTADGTRYYVMPLVEARSLRQRLADGPLEVREAVRLACEIADALAAAHAAGVVHRDVKPENILLEAGHAVVADFGVAVQTRRTAREESSPERLTADGYVAGTIEYMSPEQAAGDRDLDGRSDTYSLGCVVYEMLAGRPPFTGRTAREVLAGRFRAAPPPLATVRPSITAELSAAVNRALALDPADRYATISDFANALQDAVAGLTSGGAPVAAGRRRWRTVVVPLTVLAAIAGGAVILRARLQAMPEFDSGRVVVAVLNNETGNRGLDPIGHLVAEQIRNGLSATRLRVVTSASTVPALHDARTAGNDLDDPVRLGLMAAETHAATVVSGSYYLARDEIEFLVEITDARSGELLRSIGPVRRPASAADRAADELSRRVIAAVDTLFPAPPPAGDAHS
jgi:eukaryotic-like serine/threonine-protein kinase